MERYYLAVDIGASSGRHMLGHLADGKMMLEEIYRFPNGMKQKGQSLCWDLELLFSEIMEGLCRCRRLGKIPVSMGVDTWAVDYVLLDSQDRILGDSFGYRDGRTQGMDRLVAERISPEELYSRTGIQKQTFNTIYQLEAVRRTHPEYLEQAETFLMLPDYFHFLLTGRKYSEYTNATSTQLVNAQSGSWDLELLERLGLPSSIFLPLQMPGFQAGALRDELAERAGFSCRVVLPATHDTASAVMAVPCPEGDCLYISSGTWSLIGTENQKPICTPESRQKNLTNEGGYEKRFRYLKNIMGLWMIQCLRHELGDAYSFGQLADMAQACDSFPSRVDVNSQVFLAPESMRKAIQDQCRESGQPVPETPGELAAVIYHSLAESYAQAAGEIEALTGKRFESICIVGGGSNADYLNLLTARESGRRVLAGPGEATAAGNLMAQMIAGGEFESLAQARRCAARSFPLKEYLP